METNSTILCLHKLFNTDIKKFLSAEAELKSALSLWATNSMAGSFRTLLLDYQDVIQGHIEKLNGLIVKEQITTVPILNKVMLALIYEANEATSVCKYQEVKDACLLGGVQNIIHWKIGSYGTAATFASTLELEGIASVFHQLVKNEKYFDERLTHLAKHNINNLAVEPLSQLDD